MGVIGTFILTFFTITPFVVSFVEPHSALNVKDTSINVRNYQTALAHEVQKIDQKYKDDSILNTIRNDLKIFDGLDGQEKFTFKFVKQHFTNTGVTEREFKKDKASIYIFTELTSSLDKFQITGNNNQDGAENYPNIEEFNNNYIYDLFRAGLMNEIETLPVYQVDLKQVDATLIATDLYEYRVELTPEYKKQIVNTQTWKWMNKLTKDINYDNSKDHSIAYTEKAILNSNLVEPERN